jgi:GT2 family glycosyltransferase
VPGAFVSAPSFDASIIIATCNPVSTLEPTIRSIEAHLGGLKCELIIVRNGQQNLSATQVYERSCLHLIELSEIKAGKSRALNRGLEMASGELIIFTDDDVLVSPQWLADLVGACKAYPQEVGFCGPVIPRFPSGTQFWLPSHVFASVLFATFKYDIPEGPLPPHALPLGPNLAVRASAAKSLRFRLDLGPSEENGWLMCEDTAFSSELRDRYSILTDSGGFIYVPSASVTHLISPHKLQFPWMMERYFNLGRSRIVRFNRITHISRRPGELLNSRRSELQIRLRSGAELNFYCGQLYQCRREGDKSRIDFLEALLDKFEWQSRHDLLCPSMRSILAATLGSIPETGRVSSEIA